MHYLRGLSGHNDANGLLPLLRNVVCVCVHGIAHCGSLIIDGATDQQILKAVLTIGRNRFALLQPTSSTAVKEQLLCIWMYLDLQCVQVWCAVVVWAISGP